MLAEWWVVQMNFKIIKKSKGFTETRSPITADEALDGIYAARGTPIIVEITDEHGGLVSEAQLKRTARS
jgi:hypothetical protein